MTPASKPGDRVLVECATEDDDRLKCESCGADTPGSECRSTLDGADLCAACISAWESEMASCQHEWRASDHFHPKPSRACEKCGMVEELAALARGTPPMPGEREMLPRGRHDAYRRAALAQPQPAAGVVEIAAKGIDHAAFMDDRSNWTHRRRAAELAATSMLTALAAAGLTVAPEQGWRSIETAPKDGTRILIMFVHPSAAFSQDPWGEGWIAVHEARWINHNGGGWTWNGLCGAPTKWMPLPSPPERAGGTQG